MAQKKVSNINDELDIKLFLYITKRSLLYVILFLVIAYSAAFFYIRYTYPIYYSGATIQIYSNDESVNKILETDKQVLGDQPNDLTQARELIGSPVFLSQSLSKLPLNISYFYEGRILSYEQYKTAPYSVESNVTNPSIYGVPIYIKFLSKSKIEISYTLPGSKKYQRQFDISQKFNIPEAELSVKIANAEKLDFNQGILDQNCYYFVINNPDNIISGISSEISIVILNEGAKTIQISIKDKNPDKANDIITAIVDNYKIYGIARKAESANSVLDFINNQLKIVYDTLFKSELDLDNFKKLNNVDSATMEPLPNIYTRVNDFQDQILSIEIKENLLTEIETNLKNKDLDVYKLIAIIAGSEFEGSVSGYLTALQDLLLKKEQLLYSVTKSSSQIELINYQISIQKKLITEVIDAFKNHLSEKKVKLNRFLEEYQKSAFNPREKYNDLELSRLQRIYSINESFYNKLIEKKAEYQISKAGYVSQIVVLDKSIVPKDPISPRKRMIYLGCILIAVMISIGLILVRYLFYNEITSINDIIKYTDTPVLGIIPKYNKDIPVSQLIVDQKPKSLIAEALRSVRTNLQFISNEPGPKVIALTSTISGEGKTFVSLNFAGVIAFSEKKVIVMDFDLRKPKIHLGFNVENKKGVSTILMGLNKVDDCIQHSNIEYLDFITAGPVPPNPAELMLNQRMIDMVDYLKTKYDVIVIDNPPIGIVTDGMRSMQLADYPIYIFKANHSKRIFVQNVDRLIAESNLKKLAIILNAVDQQHSGYSYGKGSSYGKSYGYGYGYGYGYAYGYGYGYYDEDHLMPVKKKFILDRISDFIFKYIFKKKQ